MNSNELYFRWSAWKGLAKRVPGYGHNYKERMSYELDMFVESELFDYFLVEAQILKEARKRGIVIGPSRGSTSGSLATYAMEIHDVDPLKHGLIVERFYNPQRKSMFDIDTDVAESQRQQLIELAIEMYGEDRVAIIGTYNTIGAKDALQKSAKILGYSVDEGKEYKSHLPPAKFGRAPGLDQYTGPKDEVYRLALSFEGMIAGQSQHAAGVILSSEPLADLVPLRKASGQGNWIVEFDMNECESQGLVKMDYLGLSTLDIIRIALGYLKMDWYSLPFTPDECNDPKVYQMLSDGGRSGVFQLDGPAGRGCTKKIKPQQFSDIVAATALIRPGAAEHMGDYAVRTGPFQPSWRIHPELGCLDEILTPSRGVLLYQEQVLEALAAICGWSYAEADLVLGALRKKKLDKLEAAKPEYLRDGKTKGFSEECLEVFWETLIPFADYSFAKNHAAAYSLITYWTAWLIVNHPNEFYAASLTNVADDKEKLGTYLTELKRNGVKLLPPDINESGVSFSPSKDGVRFGLQAIKGAGGIIPGLYADREVKSLADFYENIPDKMNKGVLDVLIRGGALDRFGNRVEHAEKAPEFLELAKSHGSALANGDRPIIKPKYSVLKSQTQRQILREWEEELLGSALTSQMMSAIMSRELDEKEWVWVLDVLSKYAGQEKLTFVLNGTEFSACQTVTPSAKLAQTLNALDPLEVAIE